MHILPRIANICTGVIENHRVKDKKSLYLVRNKNAARTGKSRTVGGRLRSIHSDRKDGGERPSGPVSVALSGKADADRWIRGPDIVAVVGGWLDLLFRQAGNLGYGGVVFFFSGGAECAEIPTSGCSVGGRLTWRHTM